MKTIVFWVFSLILLLLGGVAPHNVLLRQPIHLCKQQQHNNLSSQEKPHHAVSKKNETPSSTAASKAGMKNISPSRRYCKASARQLIWHPRVSALHRSVSKFVGESLATIGLLSSMIVSSPEALFFQKPMVQLHVYLKDSGIGDEIGNVMKLQMVGPLRALSKMQSNYRAANDVRDLVLQNNNSSSAKKIPSMQEAARYMRFATAAYGDHMMRGARFGRMAAGGHIMWYTSFLPRIPFVSPTTQQRIGAHCGIPTRDVVHMDTEFRSRKGRRNHLCHFVAVDHAHKAVVLSIRGTFSLTDLIVDATGFSKPFCGGEAHAHMAFMAERTWNESRPHIEQALSRNKGYTLVLTGHSLGAGVAWLVHMLVPSSFSSSRNRCFVYGCPPVFSPLELVPKHVVDSTTCYIHGDDTVPFLSMTSVRKLVDDIQYIKERKYQHSFLRRLLPFRIFQSFSQEKEETSNNNRLLHGNTKITPKRGSPLLIVPASTIVWTKQKATSRENSTNQEPEFDYKLCDPAKLARLGISLSKRAMADHALAIYEEALHYFEGQQQQQQQQ
mmetsp:Transcript_9891/g.14582  ORF Transcript_9891/g.14582 Transcript_9891/m.14582 type:complete len:554 (-) Transcript_9891:92-1753(-)